MARFTGSSGGGSGAPGPQGPAGQDGAPGAGFGIFYLGNYNPNSGYVPDIAVVRGSDGQLYLAKASGQLGDPVGNTAQWEVWIPKGQDGAPGATPFTLVGAYDNGVSYNLGIAVYYNGGTYVRTGNPLNPGYPPTPGSINESWTPIADKGDAGEGLNFRGAWVTDTLYLQNDVVTQNGSTYIANYDYQDTSGPSLDGDLWAPIALKGDTGPQGPAGEGGDSGPKTWTAPNDSIYEIHQAHGGIEVTLDQPSFYEDTITVVGNVTNSSTLTVSVPVELSGYMINIYSNGVYFRRLSMDFNGQTRNFSIAYPTGNENEWVIQSLDGPLTTYNGNSYYVNLEYGGAPVMWWDADNLGTISPGDEWKFRGAKIEYHAYSTDSGTMIGTIYIASDSGDNYVTHIETNSGANDNGNVVLWNRSGNERELYAYRVDNEDDTVRIHWTAQVYYGTEYYD